MIGRAASAHRAQKAGIEAFGDQRPPDHRQRQQRQAAYGGDQRQRRAVHGQDGAEQHMQQIDIGAARRDDQHAERQAGEVEACQTGILLELGGARDQSRQQRHAQPRDQPAERHGRQRQARQQEGDGRARQDGVRHGIAHQAHAAQHQQHADGAAAQRQGEAGGQRPAHEAVGHERLDEGVIEAHQRAPVHGPGA